MSFPDIWKWLCSFPRLHDWETSLISTEICRSEDNARKFMLVAEKTLAPDDSVWSVTLSLVLSGEWPQKCCHKTLWVSKPFTFGTEESMQKTTLPLLLQLAEEIINRAPNLGFKTPLGMEKNKNISETLLSMESDSYKDLCNFLFLCKFFWVCAFESTWEVGSLYFEMVQNIVAPRQALKSFMVAVGADYELYFMRAVGYMYTKFMCLRSWPDDGEGFEPLAYSNSISGYLMVRSYAPLLSMKDLETHQKFQLPNTHDSVLQYTLIHQQLEVVIQFKYGIVMLEDCIEVQMSIDNVRCKVSPLSFGKTKGFSEEGHFPSRIRFSVAPEDGSQVLMMSLSKSTENPIRKLASHNIIFNGDCYSKLPGYIKAIAAFSGSEYTNSWKFEQRGEGNTGTMEWTLYDNMSGKEVASSMSSKTKRFMVNRRAWYRDRSRKESRCFNKEGGVVFGGDVYGENSLVWRLKRDCLEDVESLKWNVRGCIWITYCPNTCETFYCESRYMEICEQVDLRKICKATLANSRLQM